LAWAAAAGGGKVLQVVQDTDTGGFTTSSASYVDTNLSVAITPSSATSKILVVVSLAGVYARSGVSSNSAYGYFNIVRTSTQINQSGFGQATTTTNIENLAPFTLIHLDSPSTTSATTYKVQGRKGVAQDINYEATNYTASLILLEIGA
jgi:hypothetical protein